MRPIVKVSGTNLIDGSTKIATTSYIRQALRGDVKCMVPIDELAFFVPPLETRKQVVIQVQRTGKSERHSEEVLKLLRAYLGYDTVEENVQYVPTQKDEVKGFWDLPEDLTEKKLQCLGINPSFLYDSPSLSSGQTHAIQYYGI